MEDFAAAVKSEISASGSAETETTQSVPTKSHLMVEAIRDEGVMLYNKGKDVITEAKETICGSWRKQNPKFRH